MGILNTIKKNLGQEAKDEKPKTTLKEKSPKAEEKTVKTAKKEQGTVEAKSDTKEAYKILVRPLVTEKSTELANQGKYVFAVDPSANKHSVANAVKSLYGVKVLDVNMLVIRGKVKTFGRNIGKRKNIKKAIVTLAKGQKITVFEGV